MLQVKKRRYRDINWLPWNLMHWIEWPKLGVCSSQTLFWSIKKDGRLQGVGFPSYRRTTCRTWVSSISMPQQRELHVGPCGISGCQLWWQLTMTYLCLVNATQHMELTRSKAAPRRQVSEELHIACEAISTPESLIKPAALGGQGLLQFSEKILTIQWFTLNCIIWFYFEFVF